MMSTKCMGFLSVLLAYSSAFAITAGQLDNFQDATTQNWTSGLNNPNPPVNVSTGGPAGDGDAYLLVTSNGSFGAGSKLVTFNTAQWAGDYSAAGVTFIDADMANFGATALSMRVMLEGNGGNFSSVTAASLPADGVWRHVHFSIQPADLTGGFDYAATLASVFQLRIVHSSFPGGADVIAAQVGIDNITCGPVPLTITQWRSVRTHGGSTALGIVLATSASGNGMSGPTTESRQGGIQEIQVDFNMAPASVSSSAVTVTGQSTVGGVLQGPVTYTPASVAMISATTLRITFSPGQLPDATCYFIDISPGGVPGLSGDHDVNVRALIGDATSSGGVNLSDALATQARIGGLLSSNAPFDVDLSGAIALQDALAAKGAVGGLALCP